MFEVLPSASLSQQAISIQGIATDCYDYMLTRKKLGTTGYNVTCIYSMMQECHNRSLKAGWYTDPKTGQPIQRNVPEMIALMHSEVSEMTEGSLDTNSDSTKLLGFSAEEEEAADILIRLMDYAGYRELRLGMAVFTCLSIADSESMKLTSAISMHVMMHCELSRMLEGVRKNQPGIGIAGFTFEEEAAARLFVRLMAYSHQRHMKLGNAYTAKLKFNESRADHKLENRAKEDGKAF